MARFAQTKRLTKLQADLRQASARLEQARRKAEELSGQMQPRIGPVDHPEVWLLPPDALNALAGNGRAR